MGKQVRPIVDALREINNGNFLNDLSDDFHHLIGQVQEHGKKGEINIKITMTPLPGNSDIVTLSPQVTVKAPKQVANTMFHVTDEGNIQRRDPRQKDAFDLESVETVDKSTGEIIDTGSDSKDVKEVV